MQQKFSVLETVQSELTLKPKSSLKQHEMALYFTELSHLKFLLFIFTATQHCR